MGSLWSEPGLVRVGFLTESVGNGHLVTGWIAPRPALRRDHLADFVAQADRNAVKLAAVLGLPYKSLEAAAAVLDAGRKASRHVKSPAKTKGKNKSRKNARKSFLKLADAAQDWLGRNAAISTTHRARRRPHRRPAVVEVLIDVTISAPSPPRARSSL